MDFIEEAKEYWKQSPFWAKVVWGFSIFISSGSIASLSELVFSWKGFILDGINFYRDLAKPLKVIIDYFYTVDVTVVQVDLIILFSLFNVSYLRFTALKQLDRARPEQLTNALYIRTIILFVIIWLLMLVFVAAGVLDRIDGFVYFIFIWVYVFPFYYPMYVISLLKEFDIDNNSFTGQVLNAKLMKYYSNNIFKFFMVYYGPVVIAVVLTLLLAAINAGLNK